MKDIIATNSHSGSHDAVAKAENIQPLEVETLPRPDSTLPVAGT
jgi:hypothetical protein